jgi:hypothetical protein
VIDDDFSRAVMTSDLALAIAELAGVTVSAKEVEALLALMTAHYAMAERLLPLDFNDVPPIVSFDPRWR